MSPNSWSKTNVSNEPRSVPDPERLAVLLEGKASNAERARLMAQLSDSPDALEAFADAAAVHDQTPVVVPLSVRRRGTRRVAAWTAVAASIATAVMLPSLLRPRTPDLLPVEN